MSAIDWIAFAGFAIFIAGSTATYWWSRRNERQARDARYADLREQIEHVLETQSEGREQLRLASAEYEQAFEEYTREKEQRLQSLAQDQAYVRDAIADFREWQHAKLLSFRDADLPALEEIARSNPAELERMLNMIRTIIDEKDATPDHPIVIEGLPDKGVDVGAPRHRRLHLRAEFG